MSDIYLAISETPTVVTLTSAVLNSAVASSVTVVNSVTIGSLPAISGTVTANLNSPNFAGGNGDHVPFGVQIGFFDDGLGEFKKVSSSTTPLPVSGTVTVGNTVTIAGTVTANPTGTVTVGNISSLPDAGGNRVVRNFVFGYNYATELPVAVAIEGQSLSVAGTINGLQDGDGTTFGVDRNFPVDVISALPAGTNRIGVVTIGGGTVTIGAGTAQIGSVTASISGTVPVSISSVTVGNSADIIGGGYSNLFDLGDNGNLFVTIGAGTSPIGSVTASLAISSTAITSGSFSSLTSATLVPANTARKMATVYNLGAGQLFVNAGATATTLGGGFMVALSSGDYFECDFTTTTLSALFATAGTASWVSH